MRILISWLGHTDIKSLLETELAEKIKGFVGLPHALPDDGGPIKTMLLNDSFSKLYIISNLPKDITDAYVNTLGNLETKVHLTKLDNPADYLEIYKKTSEFMNLVAEDCSREGVEMNILLSSGTPAMAGIFVLLGKTRYKARFWQTWQGKSTEALIPFDITMDVVPDMINRSDDYLKKLAESYSRSGHSMPYIIGNSKPIFWAAHRAEKAARQSVSVLLTGESGTGKELFARAIHEMSPRRHRPFVAINCAAIPAELMESELFGHKRGAFTGAIADKDGAFKTAHGGTIFLDEIADCPLQIQAKLLRALQPPPGSRLSHREFSPVGATDIETSDVRIIAATNRNLAEMINERSFREDLFYRLSTINISLPPLRERCLDIEPLALRFLEEINKQFKEEDSEHQYKIFSDDAISFMKHHYWPGNVRELYNAIIQAVVMCMGNTITEDDVRSAINYNSPEHKFCSELPSDIGNGINLDSIVKSLQKNYLKEALEKTGGNKTRAAELLGMKNYQTLDAMARRLGVL
ncbi:MAG: sigma-54 interaction domain-containing protein [Phycisphaerae bacterium]|jgi:transcriptional regulator with PAS, ATPase and Fis domain